MLFRVLQQEQERARAWPTLLSHSSHLHCRLARNSRKHNLQICVGVSILYIATFHLIHEEFMKACLFEESEKALPVNILILYLFSLFSHDLCIGVMSFFFIFLHDSVLQSSRQIYLGSLKWSTKAWNISVARRIVL